MTHSTDTDLVQLIPRLRARARRLSRSHHDAEDLLQDTLLRLWQRLHDGGEIEDLAAYSMRSLQYGAQRRWAEVPNDVLEDDMAMTQPDALLRLECAETLRAVDSLPAPQRDIMRMIIDGETSPARMAMHARLPVGTVMSRLARARKQLRGRLHGDAPSRPPSP